MKLLLILLLIIGLLQSFLNLKLQGRISIKTNKKFTKYLSVIYVIGFIIAISQIIIEDREKNFFNDLNLKNSERIEKLDSSSEIQMSILENGVKKSEEIKDSFNLIHSNTLELLETQSKLINQYKVVNENLNDQIELEIRKYNSQQPILKIIDSEDIKWEKNLTSSNLIKVSLRNVGGRIVTIKNTSGSVKLYDKNKQLFGILDFPELMYDNPLEPFNQNRAVLSIRSNSFKENLEKTLSKVSVVVFKLSIDYSEGNSSANQNIIFYKANNPSKHSFFSNATNEEIELYEKK